MLPKCLSAAIVLTISLCALLSQAAMAEQGSQYALRNMHKQILDEWPSQAWTRRSKKDEFETDQEYKKRFEAARQKFNEELNRLKAKYLGREIVVLSECRPSVAGYDANRSIIPRVGMAFRGPTGVGRYCAMKPSEIYLRASSYDRRWGMSAWAKKTGECVMGGEKGRAAFVITLFNTKVDRESARRARALLRSGKLMGRATLRVADLESVFWSKTQAPQPCIISGKRLWVKVEKLELVDGAGNPVALLGLPLKARPTAAKPFTARPTKRRMAGRRSRAPMAALPPVLPALRREGKAMIVIFGLASAGALLLLIIVTLVLRARKRCGKVENKRDAADKG